MLRRLLLCLILSIVPCVLLAQRADTAVYLVNIYPGSDIYELEGHSAIVVESPGMPAMAYNYGMFDFAAPNFVYRFVKGETDYYVAAYPWEIFMSHYVRTGRRIMAHRLNMTPQQTARLIQLLDENVKPENAVYRYNYVRDNCATRPLRMIEKAMGDSIVFGPAPFESQSGVRPTFRNVMRHYHRNYPWYQFGIDLALGSGVDFTANSRDLTFAPVELDGMLAAATVDGKPLVAESAPMYDVAPDNAVLPATPWYMTPMAVACLVFLLGAFVTYRDLRRHSTCRIFDTLYYLGAGVLGCIIAFLIFVSVHEATSPNWLFLWLNPFCLLVPALIWIKKAKIVLICYQIVNFALLVGLIAAWYFLPQSANAAFLPLILTDVMRSASFLYINYRK